MLYEFVWKIQFPLLQKKKMFTPTAGRNGCLAIKLVTPVNRCPFFRLPSSYQSMPCRKPIDQNTIENNYRLISFKLKFLPSSISFMLLTKISLTWQQSSIQRQKFAKSAHSFPFGLHMVRYTKSMRDIDAVKNTKYHFLIPQLCGRARSHNTFN